MKKDRKIFVVVAIVAVILISFLIWRSGQSNTQTIFTFMCADTKNIKAVFAPQEVSLTLSSGKRLDLKQTLSASGVRYATLDGGIVFWNKGDEAFIEESGVATYKDCKVVK